MDNKKVIAHIDREYSKLIEPIKYQTQYQQQVNKSYEKIYSTEYNNLKLYLVNYEHIDVEKLREIFAYFHETINSKIEEYRRIYENEEDYDWLNHQIKDLFRKIKDLQNNLNNSKYKFKMKEPYEKYIHKNDNTDYADLEILGVGPIFELTQGLEFFQELITKLYDKNWDLGKTFQDKVRYKSFENSLLTWESMLSDDEKSLLTVNFPYIKKIVKEIFGSKVEIKNVSVIDIDRTNNQSKNIETKSKNLKLKGIEMKYKFSDNKDDEIIYEFPFKNILLKGVPGTGKSRTLENIINKHLNLKEHYNTNVRRINIHSASSNADLMQGIAINSNSDGHIEYKEKQGLILELIERATFNPNQPFVLILEEIQENSLNELIGDLIYLIEDSKRADGYKADNKEYAYSELVTEIMKQNSKIDSVELPSLISKQEKIKQMIIPHNLFIFCTSNYRDDRKVIEDNLLRRFEVIEIYPKYKDTIGDDFKNDDVSNFLKDLNTSIVKVCSDNGEIHPDRFMIGHSIWLEVEDKKAFSRAFLKVITEFKDVKDMHFDDFQKIIKEIKIFGITISIENSGSYEVLINILQNDCYKFLSDK